MFYLLGKGPYTLELAAGRSESEFVFRHRFRRRNKFVLHIQDRMVDHFRDRPAFILTLGILGCAKRGQRQHAKSKTAESLLHEDSSVQAVAVLVPNDIPNH